MKKFFVFSLVISFCFGVSAQTSCTSNFAAYPLSGTTIKFIQSASNPPKNAYKVSEWDFGDGTTYNFSHIESISHTYASLGVYNVTKSTYYIGYLGDTICSTSFSRPVYVDTLYNTGCDAILDVQMDTANPFVFMAKDVSPTSTFSVPVYERLWFVYNDFALGSVDGPQQTHTSGDGYGSVFYKSGNNTIRLIKAYYDNSGNLVCESMDEAQVYVQEQISTTSSLSTTAIGNGVYKISINHHAVGLDTNLHKEAFWWGFVKGDYRGMEEVVAENGADITYRFRKPGQYIVDGHYQVLDKITDEILGASYGVDTITVQEQNYCNAEFSFEVENSSRHVTFNNSSISMYGDTTGVFYEWDLGDGTQSTDENPGHTYAAGTYLVSLKTFVKDRADNVICSDSISKYISIGQTYTRSCNASFYLDTATSSSSVLNIYNNSIPVVGDTALQSITYSWSFGDSATSNLAYPTHYYDSLGTYNLCLAIKATYVNGDVCVDTLCKTIGIDSLGNFYGKTTSGFTLNVLNPNSIGLQEADKVDVVVYPNPASDNVYIQGVVGNATYQVYSLNGMLVKEGELLDNRGISVEDLKNGLYLLSIQSDTQVETLKLQVRK